MKKIVQKKTIIILYINTQTVLNRYVFSYSKEKIHCKDGDITI